MFWLNMHGLNLEKIKDDETVLNGSIEIVIEYNRKPNNLWVDQGREFYNKLIEEWLTNNDILIHSKNNEGKSVIVE